MYSSVLQPLVKKGTGLGLSITRSFVELMGGTLSAKSELGRGALFRIELPVEVAEADEILPVQKPHRQVIGLAQNQSQCRVLIMEDDEHNLLLLKTLLTQVGLSVQVARNGKEVVDIFLEWQPHLIFMDMGMPLMNGYEATKRIRKHRTGDKVKIIALTASVFKEQEENIFVADCDDILHKPYYSYEVFDAISQY